MYDDENAAQTALEQLRRTSFQSSRFSRPDLERQASTRFLPSRPSPTTR